MRKITKRFISEILVLALLFSFVGCGKIETSNNKNESGEIIKLITWDNEGTVEALNTINEKFFEETGIKVEMETVESSEYDAFLNEKMKAGDADIFCYTVDSKAFAQPVVDWAPSEELAWESIITSGQALDLSGNEFLNNWDTGAEACRYKDGIYGIATGMTIMNGIFYNKKMFEEHGWQEPRTWDEFVKLCEDIRAEGIEPLTAGGADTWPVQMITNAVVDSVEQDNVENLSEELWKGTRKYTDEKSMEIYRREKQILSFMEPDFMKLSYADAPAHFVEGSVAMLYDGSWNATGIEKADPEFEYDYFALPGDDRYCFTGKYDLTFGINAKSEKTDAALKWLEYFSQPDIYTIYIDSNGFVPTMSWISTSNKFLMMINDRLKDADRTFECYNRVPSEMGPYGTYDLINYSVTGGVFNTPEEFAQAAQADWDAAMKKAK